MSDRGIVYATAFVRSVAVGTTGVLLGTYLPRVGLDAAGAGRVVGAGLAGATLATLLATLAADRMGRRRFLVATSLLGAAGTAAAAIASTPWLLSAAAFLGMVNGMGRDRGAALVLEQALLPATVDDAHRTRAFAWYNVLQDGGHALGALLAAAPALLHHLAGLDDLLALRLGVGATGALLVLTGAAYPRMSRAVEPAETGPRVRVSSASRRVLWRISALFAVDSLAGGFLTTALLALFFFERFGVDEAVIGPLFAGARVANAVSHLAAAWLARRIGLVNTMVFTHLPSSLLLATVPLAPSFPVAATLFLLREGLVEMDVPTRQSYVLAVVRPDERTVASGVTHLVRTGGWAVSPSFAGALMQAVSPGAPILVGAGMKVAYDLLLWAAFRRTKPPEEGADPA